MTVIATAKVKLVTIILPFQLEERLAKDLGELGARGYSVVKVDGRGTHGPRKYDFLDGSNIRVETVVKPEIAEAILQHLGKQYATEALVAYAVEVEAIPSDHFG